MSEVDGLASSIFLYEVVMKNYIIPIFIPHYGCEHECVFCNQHKITGAQTNVTAAFIKQTIEEHLRSINVDRPVEVAFYGGSFTALSIAKQNQLLETAHALLRKKRIHYIRISTRPDCIDDSILQNLLLHGVSTIEIGVQSFEDEVLRAAHRGHTEADIVYAISCIRKTPLYLGLQLMPGLPKDTWKTMMGTLDKVIAVKPDFVRIYPTIVLQSTKLAELFHKNEYQPLSLKQAAMYCALMHLAFKQNGIKVIRTGLQATEQLSGSEAVLAGPYHPAFGEMAEMHLFQFMICQLLERLPVKNKVITLKHHAKDTSKIRGVKNMNTRLWYKLYQPQMILFKQDLLKSDRIILICDNQKYFLHKNLFSTI